MVFHNSYTITFSLPLAALMLTLYQSLTLSLTRYLFCIVIRVQ